MKGRPTKREQVFIEKRNKLIREFYHKDAIHIADIARMFNVPESVIFKIVNAK